MLEITRHGLFCPQGDFFIDPWRPVDRAVVTHLHSDHARTGSRHYLLSAESLPLAAVRLGGHANCQGLDYGETIDFNGVKLSLHPAGHIWGSAQVRLEHRGKVTVVTGDFKVAPDPTARPLEAIPCHHLIMESTFGLPVYRWPSEATVVADIEQWWRANQSDGHVSVLLGYALGKAQRLLASLTADLGPVVVHGAVEQLNEAYRQAGCQLPRTLTAQEWSQSQRAAPPLVIAPPSAANTPWLRRFEPWRSAAASGWMLIRGVRRRRGVDRGFVMSDHADWPGLLSAVAAAQPEHIWVTHGYSAILSRYLSEQLGLRAEVIPTPFQGEGAELSEVEMLDGTAAEAEED